MSEQTRKLAEQLIESIVGDVQTGIDAVKHKIHEATGPSQPSRRTRAGVDVDAFDQAVSSVMKMGAGSPLSALILDEYESILNRLAWGRGRA